MALWVHLKLGPKEAQPKTRVCMYIDYWGMASGSNGRRKESGHRKKIKGVLLSESSSWATRALPHGKTAGGSMAHFSDIPARE